MGPYCMYCDQRCFVLRRLADTGRRLLMATCAAGMDHDQIMTGFTHKTAINPRPQSTGVVEVDQ